MRKGGARDTKRRYVKRKGGEGIKKEIYGSGVQNRVI
jgi:hypothetical protein